MSDVVHVAKKAGKLASKAVGTALGFVVGGPIGAVAGYKAGSAVGKKVIGRTGGAVQEPGGPPTVDMAAQNQQVADRIRMRRGVLANLYGGGAGGAPSVATKSLLGS